MRRILGENSEERKLKRISTVAYELKIVTFEIRTNDLEMRRFHVLGRAESRKSTSSFLAFKSYI